MSLSWSPSEKYVLEGEILFLVCVMVEMVGLRLGAIFLGAKTIITIAFFRVDEGIIGLGDFFEDVFGSWMVGKIP